MPELTDLPEEVTLRPGVEETIQLPSLAGAGYVWEADVENEAVAEASTEFQGADEKTVAGRTFSRNELLRLRGHRAGTTQIRLVQRRPWEIGVDPVALHSLTVKVVAERPKATEGGTR